MLRLKSILAIAALSVSFASPCNSADSGKSHNVAIEKKQVGTRVGLVLAYSGEWVLENGKNHRPIKQRGFSVYEGERPLRTSKDGSLTVACLNNTTAICPGNHKIGEPFLLSEVEQVDDWWAQLLPFLSNYGSWIYPANRNLDGAVSLNDAVICQPAARKAYDLSDVVSSLPDGAYKVEFAEFPEDRQAGKNWVRVDIVKKDGTALTTKWNVLVPSASTSAQAEAINLFPGVYTFKILSGPASAKIDWSTLDPALVEIVDSAKYQVHRATLQLAMKKTESWKGAKLSSARTELIRALIVAQSKAPESAYPQAFKTTQN